MDHHTHQSEEKNDTDVHERPHGYVLRIPKPNWQVTALVLIALVAGFQMVQLISLKGKIAPKASAAAPATAAAAPSTSSSALPSQVGGC